MIEDAPPAGTVLHGYEAGGTTVECALEKAAPYTFGACPSDLAPVTRVRWTAAEATIVTPVVTRMTVAFPSGARPQKATLTNTAQVSSRQTTLKPSNTVLAEVTTSARLALAKSVSPTGAVVPGARLDYSLKYSSTGSADAEGVVLTDPVPVGTTYVAGSAATGAEFLVGGAYQAAEPADPTQVTGLRWQLGTVARSTEGTRGFAVTVSPKTAPGTTVVNEATVQGAGVAPVTSSVSTPVTGGASLTVAKTALDPVALIGGRVRYRLTVSSTGTIPATGVVLTDTLPAGLSFVSSTGGKPKVTRGVLRWTLGDLAPGATVTRVVTTAVTPAARGKARLVNTAVAEAGNAEDPTVTATVPGPAAAPRLVVTKAAPRRVNAGALIPWTITVRNAGTSPATACASPTPCRPG